MATQKTEKPEPKVTVRLVDPDADPELPIEERMDYDATKKFHKDCKERGKIPTFAADAIRKLGFHAPTPADTKFVEMHRMAGSRICGNCRHYDHPAGQEYLAAGGAGELREKMGKSGFEHLGDVTRYGVCEATGGLAAFESPAHDCPQFGDVKKGAFGRILGGVWRRKRDI